MGWLYRDRPLRGETVVEYFRRELTFDRDGRSASVLDAAAVRGTVYAAVRNKDVSKGTDYVYCAVILFKNSERDGFGYKDMCESMGPCEVDCPDRIMKLLSPVEQIPNPSYTETWRARVALAKETRRRTAQMAGLLKPGVVIRLAHEASFGKANVVATEFRLLYLRKRTPIFEPVNAPGLLCRLRRQTLEGARVVEQVAVEAAGAD